MFFATNASGGAVAPVTAVNSNPTIAVNGTSVAIAGPTWTNTSLVLPGVVYQLLCGALEEVIVQTRGSGYSNPVATASGITFGTPTLLNGVIGSVTITNGGSGYTRGGSLIATDATGSGFVAVATYSGGAMTGILIESGGSNYTSPTITLSGEFGLGGSGATFSATLVNGAIGTVPIVSSPTNLTSAPAITISDSGGGSGSGAVAAALMSGPRSTDTVTFSASSGWLTTSAGTTPGATNAAMANYGGALEPAFTVTPTMPLGMNIMSPFGFAGGKAINQNWLKGIQAPFNGASNPTLTISDSTGSLAVAYGTVNSSGQVTAWVVPCGGIGYTGPTAVATAPASGGTTATAGAITVVGGVITAIAVGNAGSGYGGSTVDGHPIAINSTVDASNASTGGYPGAISRWPTPPTVPSTAPTAWACPTRPGPGRMSPTRPHRRPP